MDFTKLLLNPPHEAIAALAKKFWEEGGENAESNWLAAEAQLKAELIKKTLSPILQELAGQLVELSSEHDHALADSINSHLRDEDVRDDYVLVDNLKFYRNFGERQVVVLEESPKTRTLYMDLRFNSPNIGSYDEGSFSKSEAHTTPISLALPYVVYVVNTVKRGSKYVYNNMYLAFSNQPLKSLKQNVYVPLLPNMGSRSGSTTWLCCKNLKSEKDTPMEVAQDVITQFWQSQFNYMLFKPKNLAIPTFEAWAEKSKENPLFVLDIEWPTQSYSLLSTLNLENQGRINQLKKVISENKQTYVKEIRKVLNDILAPQKTS